MNIETIVNKLGINLSAMQKNVINAILQTKNDLTVLSPTGTGKTYAYLIPLITKLNPDNINIQAVVIVPGRELALQTAEVVKNMKCGIKAMALYGGRPTMEEHTFMRKEKPQIIFATPGRINDHLEKSNIQAITVEWLVIDEFDKCLQLGFQQEMIDIINKLTNIKRRILLSATDMDEIPKFISITRNIYINFLDNKNKLSDRVNLYKINSPNIDKLNTLYKILCRIGDKSTIVFLNHRESVMRTTDYLEKKGFIISAFHGGLTQREREAALYLFSNGSTNIMISTNLAARGLDIPNIDNIIHYHLPETEEDYIHRIGRTARWNKTGKSYFILNKNETIPIFVKEKVSNFDIPITEQKPITPRMATIYIGKGKKDKISKGDVVGFLCKKANLDITEIGKIDIMSRFTYVAIPINKISSIIKLTKGEKIKGINTVIEEIKSIK